MTDLARTTTTTLLLDGLFDPQNQAVWESFDARYRPIILAFAQRLGLSPHDAADIAQESLARFVQAYRDGKYDRSRGRLRSWIISIVRYRVADLRRANAARPMRGESALGDPPSDDEMFALWEREHRAAMIREALRALRETSRFGETTIRAFEQFVLEQRPAADVAGELSLTAHDVYMAKNRIAERLREILTRLEAAYDD